MWRGGVAKHGDGYVYEWVGDHPYAWQGYVLQHRLVMERWLRENKPDSPYLTMVNGRLYLSQEFLVHHRDENKSNNLIENLECMTDSDHMRHHRGNRVSLQCKGCTKDFEVPAYRAKTARYCSRKCWDDAMRRDAASEGQD